MRIHRTTKLLYATGLALAGSYNTAEALCAPLQRIAVDLPAPDVPDQTVTIQIAGEPIAGQRVSVAVSAAAGMGLRLLVEDPSAETGLAGDLADLGQCLGVAPSRMFQGIADERGRWSLELRAPTEGTTLRFQAVLQSGSAHVFSRVVELTALPPYDPQPGDVVITEILADPGDDLDAPGEWIEIRNNSSYDLDLEGWTLRDDGGDFHVIGEPVLLASRAYAVLAGDGAAARMAGIDPLYQFDSFFLDDVADQVILSDVDGGMIDRAVYDVSTSLSSGVSGISLRRSLGALDSALISKVTSWCYIPASPVGGSPGTVNPCCPSDGPDVPDLNFLDSNCDGIDGDIARAIFVSQGGAFGNPGTMDSPVPDVQFGIQLASQDPTKDHVYVSEGTYVGTVVLTDGVSVFGGYSESNGWARSNQYLTTLRAEVPVTEGMVGIHGSALSAPMTLGGLRVETADAPALSGMHNYAILLQQSPDVRLEGVVVDAGDGGSGAQGADGADGLDGTDGRDATTSINWVPGYWFFWVWIPGYSYTEYEWGGVAGFGAYPGGRGGAGGAWDGYDGYSANAYPFSSTASGGAGGVWIGGGSDGSYGADGFSGGTYPAPSNSGFVASGLWSVDGKGLDGRDGAAGGGGGGGGGGSGAFGNALGHGGGGGGGGAWPGTGGRSGNPGGSSFALFLTQSAAVLDACTLVAGRGVDGGAGGQGGAGGAGGAGGGTYSPALVGRLPGGGGGSGGDGGDGGQGVGGGGGYSYGVLADSMSSVSLTASSVMAGSPGSGGSSPASKAIGKPGQAAAVRQL